MQLNLPSTAGKREIYIEREGDASINFNYDNQIEKPSLLGSSAGATIYGIYTAFNTH